MNQRNGRFVRRSSALIRSQQKSWKYSFLYCKTYVTESLDLPKLDQKWRKKWHASSGQKKNHEKSQALLTNKRKSMYILPMFPYPSGDLHLGHLRVYTISDVLARFYRMCGYFVIHPIGWDAFGLPAENAAIEKGVDPKSWTKQNIEKMKVQLENMNGDWDWSREFATSDSSFYKHTQRLFTMLHKKGLVYQAESEVNFDPVDQTVVANEQVDVNGLCWRSGAKVEKRILKQWFLRISKYRQELLDDLILLEKNSAWPERVLSMQRNWLGKSTGTNVKFSINESNLDFNSIEVFTTRPDTLLGVQYLALATTHPIVQHLAKKDPKLRDFMKTIQYLPENTKAGYLLAKISAINPLSHEKYIPEFVKVPIPIFVAPYVIGDYGSGAVMGVPGHDLRDHAFWLQNSPEKQIRCIVTSNSDQSVSTQRSIPFTSHGYLTSECGPFSNLTTTEASKKIVDTLRSSGYGSSTETWKLRDWLISRQRYWGTPIPIVHCDHCGPVAVPDEQLPVELPPVSAHWKKEKVGNPLKDAHEWINTNCPSCGRPARRDTDTMDTFVDSSWYFLRYLDPQNENEFVSLEIARSNLPVDVYVGGVEHAILHLLYARFIFKFLSDTYLKPCVSDAFKEPFKVLLAQGMVHGKTYTDPLSGRFLKTSELDLRDMKKPLIKHSYQKPCISFEKMSKSKYNGVDPSSCCEKYGADAMRAQILFQAPVTEILNWDEEKISGILRWLRRLYKYILNNRTTWINASTLLNKNFPYPTEYLTMTTQISVTNQDKRAQYYTQPIPDKLEPNKRLWRAVQGTIIKVTMSYSKTFSLNTVVSDLMTLTNTILESSCNKTNDESSNTYQINIDQVFSYLSVRKLIQMMAPIVPAFAEECWEILNTKDDIISLDSTEFSETRESVFNELFPIPDGTYDLLIPDLQPCAVHVNNRLQMTFMVQRLPVDLQMPELRLWLMRQILNSEEAKNMLISHESSKKIQRLDRDMNSAKEVIIAKAGKFVNFVL